MPATFAVGAARKADGVDERTDLLVRSDLHLRGITAITSHAAGIIDLAAEQIHGDYLRPICSAPWRSRSGARR
jgi:hypothetical protein